MKLSKLTELPTTRDMVDVFGGYNHNLRIGDGEFYDMTNLTSADYPVLSSRSKRGVYAPGNEASTPENPLGMIAKDELCYVEANADGETSTFYINGNPINFDSIDGELNAEPKTLISMGSYVIILPDKKYINTKDYNDKGRIERILVLQSPYYLVVTKCLIDGSVGEHRMIAPTDPEENKLWLDTKSIPHVLKQYKNGEWVSIDNPYISIKLHLNQGAGVPEPSFDMPDLTTVFSVGDYLNITGIKEAAAESSKYSENTLEQLDALQSVEVVNITEDSIIVKAIIDDYVIALSTSKTMRIKREMPDMDFVIESGNRLWGCKYGKALNGDMVNEIYASKLGDFKNWNAFAGISTDSYAASVGTDGEFTGAINHGGYPIFFKENCMHKVYGHYPANYQIQTTACRGVQKGCSKSLAIVNETLYYKSRSSICAYDGSLPVEISSVLGDEVYSDAVAGVLDNKYYISMKDTSGEYHLFVYDSQKGMWHREDNTQAKEFCNSNGELYFIDYDTNRIKTVRGTGTKDESPIKWSATTGIIGTTSPDKKYLSRIVLRGTLEQGTRLYLQVQYDSSSSWEQLFAMSATSLKTFSVPIRPKRCDHLRLRFVGEGAAKIFSITKTFEQGSDM